MANPVEATIGAHSLGKGLDLSVAPHGLYIGAPRRAPGGAPRGVPKETWEVNFTSVNSCQIVNLAL